MSAGPRETAFAALFALVSGAYAWTTTPSRRTKLWGDVPLAQRPTLFQYEGGVENYLYANDGQLKKRTITARLFVYTNAKDKHVIGAQQQNDILDALDAVLAPAAGDDGSGFMTLGGAVHQCRVAKVDRTPGDLDGDGIAIIDIEVIMP